MKTLYQCLLGSLLFVSSSYNYALTVKQPVNFDKNTIGQYQKEEFKVDWLTSMYSSEKDNLYISDASNLAKGPKRKKKNSHNRLSSANEDHLFKVVFPKGEVGGSAGVAFPAPLQENYDSLFFQYDVLFPAGFDAPEKGGGKLPGLASDEDESGCVSNTKGFSTRYMWRNENEQLKLYLYVYNPDKKEDCGDYIDLDTPYYFTPGQWTTLTQEVKLNTIGKADGYVRVWVNGDLHLDLQNIELRVDSSLHISYAQIDAFPGGSDPDQWAFTSEQRNYFNNFSVSETNPISTKKHQVSQS